METLVKKKKAKRIPKELIYEMRHGKPIYYRDYDKVLSGEKTLEEVMGSSKLQAILVTLILKFLFAHLDVSKYVVLTNDVGFKWEPRTWRNLGIAIFDKKNLLEEGIDRRYAKTPPEVVIEIDTKADLRKYGDFMNYAREKTQDLLDAGVKKVIWYTTFDRKVMVAEKGKPWIITDWDYDVEIMKGITLNLERTVKEEIESEV